MDNDENDATPLDWDCGEDYSQDISLDIGMPELILAYRKAKVDLYYSTFVRRFDIVNYEKNLIQNLERLAERLNGEATGWVEDVNFIGGWTVLPKSMKIPTNWDANSIMHSSAVRRLEELYAISGKEKFDASFRLMATCSIDFHVLSTLWMMRVGFKLDAKLTKHAYGGRLRPGRPSEDLRIGSFVPYAAAYNQWRSDGLSCAESLVSSGEIATIVTADAESYFHLLDPMFLLDHSFYLEEFGGPLDDDDSRLTALLVGALKAWNRKVSSDLGGIDYRGLPVGLPAATLIGNIALVGLDRLILEEFKPQYYGRYIDDVMIVFAGDGAMSTGREVRDWMVRRSSNVLDTHGMGVDGAEGDGIDGDGYLVYKRGYLDGSEIRFSNGKNRSYRLEGRSGKYILDSIRRTMAERSSEWRSLPDVPEDAESASSAIIAVTSSDGSSSSKMADVADVTSRRSGFSFKLRDYESYARDLHSREWEIPRREFFETVAESVLSIPSLFDFASYVGRLAKLGASAGDFHVVVHLLRACLEAVDWVEKFSSIRIGGDRSRKVASPAVLEAWRRRIVVEVVENSVAGSSGHIPEEWVGQLMDIAGDQPNCTGAGLLPFETRRAPGEDWASAVAAFAYYSPQFYIRDLSNIPVRFDVFDDSVRPIGYSKSWHESDIQTDRKLKVILGVRHYSALKLVAEKSSSFDVSDWAEGSEVEFEGAILGLVFPTRPIRLYEAFMNASMDAKSVTDLYNPSQVSVIMQGMRGYPAALPGDLYDHRCEECGVPGKTHEHIAVGGRRYSGSIDSAVAMLEVKESDFMAAVSGRPRMSIDRYSELSNFFNSVIRSSRSVRYLYVGEGAIPSKWFLPFALKLAESGICLVSGVEPIPRGGIDAPNDLSSKVYSNQVWALLDVGNGGHSGGFLYRQDKQLASHREERVTREHYAMDLLPRVRWEEPPVIVHRGHNFAILVCSELTNIAHRASLRGCVDWVFVPELNKDIKTFSSIVESSANDIHSFVVQVNSRAYGDTRVRGPMVKDFQRDLVRLKGGEVDYFAVVNLDLAGLREHHQLRRIQDAPKYKPLPDGFRPDPRRR